MIHELLQDTKSYLRSTRKAILGRGGEIAENAGLQDVDDAVYKIPADTSLVYQTDEGVAYEKIVPPNAEEYAQVERIGGMTYKSENLLPFPYTQMSHSENGGNFVALADGGIQASGTPTAPVMMTLYNGSASIFPRVFTYSLQGDSANTELNISIKDSAGVQLHYAYVASGKSATIDMSSYPTAANIQFNMNKYSNNIAMSGTAYPMLNEGSTAKSYSQYFNGLRNAAVSEMKSEGANYLPFPYHQKTDKTEAGVTFHIQEDGGIAVSGTPTGYCEFSLLSRYDISQLSSKFIISIQGNLSNVSYDASLWYKDGTYIVIVNSKLAGVDTAIDLSNYPNVSYLTLSIKRTQNGKECSGVAYPMINVGTTAAPYKPFHEGALDSLYISEEIRLLDGYGDGVEGCPNYIDFNRKVFVKNAPRIVLDGVTNGQKVISIGTYNGLYYGTLQVLFARLASFSMIFSHFRTDGKDVYAGKAYIAGATMRDLLMYNSDQTLTTVAAWNAWLKEQYDSGNPVTFIYAMAEPIEIDISEHLPDDNFLKVEGGGVIRAVNEYKYDAPTTINYINKVGT
jgi:hypothetical protein